MARGRSSSTLIRTRTAFNEKRNQALLVQHFGGISQSAEYILWRQLRVLPYDLLDRHAVGEAPDNHPNGNTSPSDAGLPMMHRRIGNYLLLPSRTFHLICLLSFIHGRRP